MHCTRARRILEESFSRERDPALERHLGSCPACAALDRSQQALAASFERIGRTRPEIDVTAAVMHRVRRMPPPEPAPGFSRLARTLMAAAAAALASQLAWVAWTLLGRRGDFVDALGPARMVLEAGSAMAGAAWDLVRTLLGTLAVLFEMIEPVAGGLSPLLPLYWGAALIGFLLLLTAAFGMHRARPYHGVSS